MKHLFKPEIFKRIFALLVVVLIVKLAWFAVEVLWLPSSGQSQAVSKGAKPLYYRVRLTPNQTAAPVTKADKKPVQRAAGSIDDIKLLAIYHASDMTVVTVSHKSKTKVLSKGEQINGFVLEGAGNNFAMFSKAAKSYKVFLIKGKVPATSSITSPTMKAVAHRPESKAVQGDITDAGDRKIIDRSLLDHYAKNMDDIYKNVGITEVRNGEDLSGFKITFVRKGSPFAKLGVQRNDIIKSINGQEINSYNAAFNVYKNIQNIENMTLVIQRGKEEMELEYEIN